MRARSGRHWSARLAARSAVLALDKKILTARAASVEVDGAVRLVTEGRR